MQYQIDPQDCLLLYAIHQSGSIKNASLLLKKDPSVILKRVQKISQETSLIEKMNGTWSLTEKGKKLALWAKEMQLSQTNVLEAPSLLRLGAVSFFIERVLCPQLTKAPFKEISQSHTLEVLCPPEGLEASILKGTVDIAFACGRPNDPQIGFKKVCDERWSVVCSPKMLQKIEAKRPEDRFRLLLEQPFLRHKALVPEDMLKIERNKIKTILTFDTVGALRSSAINGQGWTLLPMASVYDELQDKRLVDLSGSLQLNLKKDFLGIWWLKENKSVKDHIAPLLKWLQKTDSI